MIQIVLWRAKRKLANDGACESFSTEVRIQPNATAENNTEKFANSGKYAICCEEREKYGHLGRRNGGMRTSLQMWESICNEIPKI